MRVRKLPRTFGHGANDFWRDLPEAPAQCIKTRLGLELGQWFLAVSDGTDYQTRVLGKYTGSTRDVVIRERVLGTPGVTKIAAYSSSLDRETRRWTVSATVDTAYGATTIVTSV